MTERERNFDDAAGVIENSLTMRAIVRASVFVERPFQGRGQARRLEAATCEESATLKGSLYEGSLYEGSFHDSHDDALIDHARGVRELTLSLRHGFPSSDTLSTMPLTT